MIKFGASFSIKYARDLGLEPKEVLHAALDDLGLRRLRLMSYWDVHELEQEKYDFTGLDWQFKLAEKYGAEVSLAVGLRQPRWPEVHQPSWAKKLDKQAWETALTKFIIEVVNRYKNHPCLVSWQLENEALNRSFGIDGEFSRERLKNEFDLVKKLDSAHPVIMSTSNSWGIPLRAPLPDIVGFSLYRVMHLNKKYSYSKLPSLFFKVRAWVVRILTHRPVYIHELQAEPWGPGSTQDLTLEEQYKSMNEDRFKDVVGYAKRTGLSPIDLWGLEWWYWLKTKHEKNEVWEVAKYLFSKSNQV